VNQEESEQNEVDGPVAVLHFCNWGGSGGGVGCDRGGTKSFNPYRPLLSYGYILCQTGLSRHLLFLTSGHSDV